MSGEASVGAASKKSRPRRSRRPRRRPRGGRRTTPTRSARPVHSSSQQSGMKRRRSRAAPTTIPRLHRSASAASRLHLGCISAASRLRLREDGRRVARPVAEPHAELALLVLAQRVGRRVARHDQLHLACRVLQPARQLLGAVRHQLAVDGEEPVPGVEPSDAAAVEEAGDDGADARGRVRAEELLRLVLHDADLRARAGRVKGRRWQEGCPSLAAAGRE
mmetsp:Transcript_17001/g.49852  ORF Transcript_17001/g.49852 Transcript_17001/m.49852 type:complete len:220 (+) Transcript_17001:523-1182(+)